MISDDESVWDAVFNRDFARIDQLIRDNLELRNHLGGYFQHAAAHGDIELATFFLDCGAEINYQNERHETAFSFSCANNELEMAKYLLSRGADINTIDVGGGSPLDWAVCHASQQFRDWLVSIGGKRNDDSYDAWPPNHNDAT